jgi:alanine racemase
MQFDMVRFGIGLYGVGEMPGLQPVATLKTTIAQIKSLKEGDTVGYNRSGLLKRDSNIGTVRIGYADGYPRMLGNGKGSMWIKGKLVPTVGNVCMDMTMIDLTEVDAVEGDEVIVFGAECPVQLVAQWANTIPYEILTGIDQRVKRIYFES